MEYARVEVTPYDGCGKCLVGVRRLSRRSDATSSPTKQAEQTLRAVADVGAHIIAWADDWEVSGATDPRTRPGLGPWLRGESGPYDGIAGSAVDRIGRNVRDVLNTAYTIRDQGQTLVTADHAGVWDLDDSNQESELILKAMGAQMEHRAIQGRNRESTERLRREGRVKQAPSYGYRFVRLVPTGKVDHVTIDEPAAKIIRHVAKRILANGDERTITPATEAARLNREGVLSPRDRRAELYGRPTKGHRWGAQTVTSILRSQAALGYLMHKGRPVLDSSGRPVRLADPLWDYPTHMALLKATDYRTSRTHRAPKGRHMLSSIPTCGTCGMKLYAARVHGRDETAARVGCIGRSRGWPESAHCKPAPSIALATLEREVEEWFLAVYGDAVGTEEVYDPGTGYGAQIAELEAARERLRADRQAGLYDAQDDAEWFRTEYQRIGREIAELRALPERPAGVRRVPTGKTVEDEWHAADPVGRREMLQAFDVDVRLFPRGVTPRVVITGRDVGLPQVDITEPFYVRE